MPTFVLVHGGCHASWCWDELIPHLSAPAVTVDLPGRSGDPAELRRLSLTAFADTVVDEIVRADLTDVILVGHSMAGLTVPAVCTRIPGRIAGLVLIAASVVPPGGALLDWLPWPIRALCGVLLRFRRLNPALPRPFARYMFCNDMTPEQERDTLDRIIPEAVQVVAEPTPAGPLPPGLPITYVRFGRDQIISPARAQRMIANLPGADVVDLDAGHNGIITRPERVAAVLNAAANVSRSRGGV